MDDRLEDIRNSLVTPKNKRPFKKALLFFYESGSSLPATTFDTDGAALQNPVTADNHDNFPEFSCKEQVRIQVTDRAHQIMAIIDPWKSGVIET